MRVAITLGGIRGRMLIGDDPNRVSFARAGRVAAIDSFPMEYQCSRAELLGNSAGLTVSAARELFARFNWDLPATLLSEWLDTLRRSK